MLRIAVAALCLGVVSAGSPAWAVTAKQKMEICKFGADDQNLQGAARKSFMAKCMAKGDAPGKPAKPVAAKPKAPAEPKEAPAEE
jgi:hypothetical protein